MGTKQFDTIIIGSGISGLSAGIILAREGEKVLVLEQHSIAGGLTQTFKRAGITLPTGVHRLGALEPGQALWHYFSYLGLLDKLDLVPLSKDSFEKFYFPGQTYHVPQGHKAYEDQLRNDFPKQAKALSRYFKEMKKVTGGIELYNPANKGKTDYSSDFTLSLDQYFSNLGIEGRLKSILTANSPLYGLSSHECPVLTHFIVSDSYLNSSFRINEEGTPFTRALVESLEARGGKIQTGCRVEKLTVKDQAATGVKLSTGESLESKKIIFSAHPSLVPDLCPPKAFRPVYRKRLAQADNTPGMFGIGIKWEKKYCPVTHNDAYIYDSWNMDAPYQNSLLEGKKPGVIFLSALPQKNLDSNDPEGGYIGVTALAAMHRQDQLCLERDYGLAGKKEYRQRKALAAEKIMNSIYETFPGARGHARIVDTYSPSTFTRYTLTPEGSAYGIKKTAQAFLQGMFSPATRVKNLFLTGQSIGLSGVHGSISASVNLCRGFYQGNYLMDKIRSSHKENR